MLILQFPLRIHTLREEHYESNADYEAEEHEFSFEWNIHDCRRVIICIGYSRLGDGLFRRPNESYRLWCVGRNLVNEEVLADWGLLSPKQANKQQIRMRR